MPGASQTAAAGDEEDGLPRPVVVVSQVDHDDEPTRHRGVGSIWQSAASSWQRLGPFNAGKRIREFEEEQSTWQSWHSSRQPSNTRSSGRRIRRIRRCSSSTASWWTAQLWRGVAEELARRGYRCIVPTLPLGSHTIPVKRRRRAVAARRRGDRQRRDRGPRPVRRDTGRQRHRRRHLPAGRRRPARTGSAGWC